MKGKMNYDFQFDHNDTDSASQNSIEEEANPGLTHNPKLASQPISLSHPNFDYFSRGFDLVKSSKGKKTNLRLKISAMTMLELGFVFCKREKHSRKFVETIDSFFGESLLSLLSDPPSSYDIANPPLASEHINSRQEDSENNDYEKKQIQKEKIKGLAEDLQHLKYHIMGPTVAYGINAQGEYGISQDAIEEVEKKEKKEVITILEREVSDYKPKFVLKLSLSEKDVTHLLSSLRDLALSKDMVNFKKLIIGMKAGALDDPQDSSAD